MERFEVVLENGRGEVKLFSIPKYTLSLREKKVSDGCFCSRWLLMQGKTG